MHKNFRCIYKHFCFRTLLNWGFCLFLSLSRSRSLDSTQSCFLDPHAGPRCFIVSGLAINLFFRKGGCPTISQFCRFVSCCHQFLILLCCHIFDVWWVSDDFPVLVFCLVVMFSFRTFSFQVHFRFFIFSPSDATHIHVIVVLSSIFSLISTIFLFCMTCSRHL